MNDDNNNDDRNERTVMLSRIPKHIHEDIIHGLVQNAIWEKLQEQINSNDDVDIENHHKNHDTHYIEQVTLVYPTTSDEEDVINKKRATFTAMNISNDAKEDSKNRFEDRPYKKKLQKLSHNNDTRHSIDAVVASSSSPPEHCGYGFVRFHRVEDAIFVMTHIKCLRFDKNNITTTTKKRDVPPPPAVNGHDAYSEEHDDRAENNNTTTVLKKKPKYHTIYIGPCGSILSLSSHHDSTNNDSTQHPPPAQLPNNVCFLWTEFRCPYGTTCKFQHTGEGGCTTNRNHPRNDMTIDSNTDIDNSNNSNTNNAPTILDRRKKIKCFNHRKGKCKKDALTCPYSHNFHVKVATTRPMTTCVPCNNDTNSNDGTNMTNANPVVPPPANSTTTTNILAPQEHSVMSRNDSEKDCFDYLHKNGKCRKLLRNVPCPYRHDVTKLQERHTKQQLRQKKQRKLDKKQKLQ
jgi:hypothetical protein